MLNDVLERLNNARYSSRDAKENAFSHKDAFLTFPAPKKHRCWCELAAAFHL